MGQSHGFHCVLCQAKLHVQSIKLMFEIAIIITIIIIPHAVTVLGQSSRSSGHFFSLSAVHNTKYKIEASAVMKVLTSIHKVYYAF